MVKVPPMPKLPPPAEQPAWLTELLAVIVAQEELIKEFKEQVGTLRDEVARLKKQ